MLVLMEAEVLPDPGLPGQTLPGSIDGKKSLAFPSFMVGEVAIERLGSQLEEVPKEVRMNGFSTLTESGFGDDLLRFPGKEAPEFDGEGLARQIEDQTNGSAKR